MSATANQAAVDFVALRAEYGVSVTYDGHTYTGTRTQVRRAREARAAGQVADYQGTVRLLASELAANGSTPAAGQRVTVAGTLYRLGPCALDALGVCWQCDLGGLWL